MANKKTEPKPEKAKESAQAKTPGKSRGGKGTLMAIGIMAVGAIFMATSVILVVGMLPTFVALFTGTVRARTRVVTVGALNLAGCVPFLLDLWSGGHSIDKAFEIIASPQAIVVMYAAAATGYLIDWSLSAVISGVLYQRGRARQDAIKKRQSELVNRWGIEVSGDVAVDENGFAVSDPS